MDDTILTANPAGLCRKTRTLRRVFLFIDLEFVHEVLQASPDSRTAGRLAHLSRNDGGSRPHHLPTIGSELLPSQRLLAYVSIAVLSQLFTQHDV